MSPVWHLRIRSLRDDEQLPPELADTSRADREKVQCWTAYAIDGLVIATGYARSHQYMEHLRVLLAPCSWGPRPYVTTQNDSPDGQV